MGAFVIKFYISYLQAQIVPLLYGWQYLYYKFLLARPCQT